MPEKAKLNWRPIAEHKRDNSRWVWGRDKDGKMFDMHYARNLSGEEQPPFEGFFLEVGSGSGKFFSQCHPVEFAEKETR